MTTLSLRNFAGMIPRAGLRNVQGVPHMTAEKALNCNLLSGDLRPHRTAEYILTFDEAFVPRAAFRIPNIDDQGYDKWVAFEQEYTHFLKSPLVNDSFNRWYWTEEGQVPKYNTEQRIDQGDPEYRLGIPRPVGAPGVAPSGGTGPSTTRCYVYCFVDEFGALGPTSAVTCAAGNEDGSWAITLPDTAPPAPWDTEGAAIVAKRLFRTITGTTGGSFFFLEDVPIASTNLTDDTLSSVAAYNEQLESASWTPPPEDLIGIVAHPNGFLVGYRQNEIWFSWPYRPWAWPAEFVLATETDIQGLGIYGTSVVVTTEAHPYTCTGIRPESMTLTKYKTTEPNLSRTSIVSAPQGVYYAGANGLMLAHNQRFDLVTQPIMTQVEWQTRYKPRSLRAVRYGFEYMGWNSRNLADDFTSPGFLYTPSEPQSIFTELDTFTAFTENTDIRVFNTDAYNAQPYVSVGNELYWIFGLYSPPAKFTWRSKEFVSDRPVNFGVYDIDLDAVEIRGPVITNELIWNEQRIQTDLDSTGAPLLAGATFREGLEPNLPQNKQPMGGSPLRDIFDASFPGAYVRIRLFGDRKLRHQRRILKRGQYRANSGYKAYIWQVEIEGNANVRFIVFAETGKELTNA